MSEQPHNADHEMSDDREDTEVMTTYVDPEDNYEHYEEFGDESDLPSRPRRLLVNRWTVLLAVLLVAAACFYGGVRLEKSRVPSPSTSGSAGLSTLASRFGGASAATSGSGPAAGFASHFGGAGGFGGAAGGGGTSGTIATINGHTLVLTESSGNTVKVKLSGTTTLTKDESVSKSKLYPGDTVTVIGKNGSNGTVTATSVKDSGASSTSSASG